MIWDVHPESRIQDPDIFSIPDTGINCRLTTSAQQCERCWIQFQFADHSQKENVSHLKGQLRNSASNFFRPAWTRFYSLKKDNV